LYFKDNIEEEGVPTLESKRYEIERLVAECFLFFAERYNAVQRAFINRKGVT
jgi:hypothetical protein